MTRHWRVGIIGVVVSGWLASTGNAAPVTFGFENSNLGAFTPFSLTVNGVTASFSVRTGPGYSVQNSGSVFVVLSRFSGNFLYPNLATVAPLTIGFSEPVDSISLTFATVEQHNASSMFLNAYLGAAQVGSATGPGAFITGDTYPQGTVSFSGTTFDRVELFVPLQGAEPAIAFMIDTIAVNTTGPPAPVLQANWHFEEGANQTATDGIGGFVGQLGSSPDADVNDPEWTPGRTGVGLTFNGSQYVAVPAALALSPGTITVEAWVRSGFVPGVHQHLVAKGGNDTCTAGAYGLRTGTAGGVEFVVFGSGSALVSPESATTVWNGLWHFVTGTFDGTTVRVFVDGVEVGSGTSAGAPFAIEYTAPDQRLAVGSYLGGPCGPATLSFAGDIDQVGIWSGALSSATIAQRYAELNLPFPTQTALTASPAGSSREGEPVVLTAYVTSNNGAPAGRVEFFDGTTTLGSIVLVAGAAQVTVTSLALGDHTLAAAFTPEGLFTGSTSDPLNYTVLPAGPSPTQTTLASQPSPSVHTQSVTLTATVTSGGGPATGSVEFFDGVASIGIVTLGGGVATLTRPFLGAGTHALTCNYSGSVEFAPSTATLDHPVLPADTATSLAVAQVGVGRYALTASVAMVTPATGTPPGEVRFYDGAALLATVPLLNGQATFSTDALPVGTHTFEARYSGIADANPSASAPTTVTVDLIATVTRLESSANPALLRKTVGVRYTATVSAAVPGAGQPSGRVSFYEDGVLIAVVKLHKGSATTRVDYRAPGTCTMTAVYGGEGAFAPSTSAPLTQVIVPR